MKEEKHHLATAALLDCAKITNNTMGTLHFFCIFLNIALHRHFHYKYIYKNIYLTLHFQTSKPSETSSIDILCNDYGIRVCSTKTDTSTEGNATYSSFSHTQTILFSIKCCACVMYYCSIVNRIKLL